MQNFGQQNLRIQTENKNNLLYPIAIIWGIALLTLLGYFLYDLQFTDGYNRYFLLPWCLLTAVSIAAPNFYLIYKKQFDLFNPIVYGAWIYIFPAFCIGGVLLSLGYSEPWYLTYVRDEYVDLPMTLMYVSIGYLSLSVGYLMPYGRRIGEKIEGYLPKWNWSSQQVILPALLLLLIGFFNNTFAFISGVLGYQRLEEIGIFDGLIYLITLFGIEASFFLWLVVFREKTFNFYKIFIVGILLLFFFVKSAFQGNRGSLVLFSTLVFAAFVLSKRKIEFRHKIYGGLILTSALVIGMIYGTTFRDMRQGNEKVSIDVYAETILQTVDKLSEQDLGTSLSVGFSSLAERIDSVSALAVVVSNYKILEPYEQSFGLDNNIWNDTITFFIPRFLWKDKPVASEPHKYADLYFHYADNAFVVTPMGDLLRNFGPVGVVIGMAFLGFLLRVIYSSLVENQPFSFWRATLYFMLLTTVSYEGFYGTLIPYLTKIGFISVVGIIFIRLFIRERNRNFAAANQ